MDQEKSAAKALKEQLFRKNEAFEKTAAAKDVAAADAFCEGYKAFLGAAKTERECAAWIRDAAEKNGFVPFDSAAQYRPGDKVYLLQRNKAVILCVIGESDICDGVRIVASHIDSPRLDLKPTPLYEQDELAYFKTHYYGGIRKYQWVAIPLSLHGVFVKKDGTTQTVRIGEEAGEPQFVITDLLPHLAKEQSQRTLSDGIKGEELNILIGSRPFNTDEESEQVKLNVLHLLFEKYGVTEDDFLSAELEIVPAFPVTDIGFDRSMIGGYGHDDRVCAYPAMEAIFALDGTPKHTCLAVLTDKEEVGSMGNTGLESAYLRDFIADLAAMYSAPLRRVLHNSQCLSADVNAGFDPTFPSVHDKHNAAFLNHGAVLTKYTGSRGKGGSSDANAEFLAQMRAAFDEDGVCWQIGELGKVDEGGGGTVALYLANMDIEVVDLGVPVLSMHAPFEVVSKSDVYNTFRGCLALFRR